jgi:hypothetical protein
MFFIGRAKPTPLSAESFLSPRVSSFDCPRNEENSNVDDVQNHNQNRNDQSFYLDLIFLNFELSKLRCGNIVFILKLKLAEFQNLNCRLKHFVKKMPSLNSSISNPTF